MKLQCICCHQEIEEIGEKQPRLESGMYKGALVDKVFANYGSRYDGDFFLIGICDNCIYVNLKLKRIIQTN